MDENSITLRTGHDIPFDQLVDLYNSVNWLAYTTGDAGPKLRDAIRNSSYVVTAWSGDTLVGLARCLSDGVSICYLQDILVRPDHQRLGIGRRLLTDCLERFANVRMQVLMTDDEERQKRFYESMAYRNTRDLKSITLNAFVRMPGRDLE